MHISRRESRSICSPSCVYKKFLNNTNKDDFRSLFHGFYTEEVDPVSDTASFARMANMMEKNPSNIVFISISSTVKAAGFDILTHIEPEEKVSSVRFFRSTPAAADTVLEVPVDEGDESVASTASRFPDLREANSSSLGRKKIVYSNGLILCLERRTAYGLFYLYMQHTLWLQ